MKIIDVQNIFQCDICGYQWRSSRTNLTWTPKQCPGCKSKDWNSANYQDGFTNDFLAQVKRLAE